MSRFVSCRTIYFQIVVLIVVTSVGRCSPISEQDDDIRVDARGPHRLDGGRRLKRDVTPTGSDDYAGISPQNRSACATGENPSTIVKNTTDRLRRLREQLTNEGIHAYIIPTDDAHQSEYVSKYDMRRKWISGFSGSAGTAVVTRTKSAQWTDGRYFLQADEELDCNWIFMQQGEAGYPTIVQWLEATLQVGDKVGADPHLMPIRSWESYSSGLSKMGLELVPIEKDLIDEIWTTDRPAEPSFSPLLVLNISFSGKTWEDKVKDVQKSMKENKVQALVITALDEIAWLFNLRAQDIPYNPMFFSYAIVETSKVTLYLRNMTRLSSYPDVQAHLNVNSIGVCRGATPCAQQVMNYDNILNDIEAISNRSDVQKVWISPTSSYAVYTKVNQTKILKKSSPILLMKAKKNSMEIENMKNCQIRDSATLIEFMAMLEPSVQKGTKQWDEISAHEELDRYRINSKWNRGLSFDTISAFGSNGAVIHYTPQPATKKDITTDGVYLLDSGGQYLDGTTDVTRSFHFGTPTAKEKEAYTRVLMGVIDLAQTIWPEGTYGRHIDAIARVPLWNVGWNYRHGTGHGIGMFLNVHEGPSSVSPGYRSTQQPLYEGMFLSDEPGYYEPNSFGIRLETIVTVIKAKTKYQFGSSPYLTFEAVTLVPFELNLIQLNLLTNKQIAWLNKYHKACDDKVGPYLKAQNKMDAYEWLRKRTIPVLMVDTCVSQGQSINKHGASYIAIIFFARILVQCIN